MEQWTSGDGAFTQNGISVADKMSIMNNAGLGQNVPNPFSVSTSVSFTIPDRQHIKVELYNSTGQLLETLVNGIYDAGVHSFKFNPVGYADGNYFYKMTAGNYSRTKCMSIQGHRK